MRDHHFQMLQESYFNNWKERHQVHFDFSTWNRDLRRRDVILYYPRVYSRRMQCVECDDVDSGSDDGNLEKEGEGRGRGKKCEAFVIPLPKKGDENRFADGMHVAEDSPDEETYVVIQRVV